VDAVDDRALLKSAAPRRRRLRRTAALAVLLAVSGAAVARVFESRPGSGVSDLLRAAGGREVHAAPVTVNGTAGRLSVLRFDAPLPEVAALLSRTLERPLPASGSMVRFEAEFADRGVRGLILRLEPMSVTVVIALEQEPEAFRRAALPPPPEALAGLPAFPASRPRLAVSDPVAGFRLAFSETDASPESVLSRLDDDLRASGWRLAMPGAGASPLRVYERGAALCCAFVSAESAGRSLITLLQRGRGLE
jgi:hypothetical protein